MDSAREHPRGDESARHSRMSSGEGSGRESREGSTPAAFSAIMQTAWMRSPLSLTLNKARPPVVVSFGAKFVQCGFAGENWPRAIVRTEQLIDADDLAKLHGPKDEAKKIATKFLRKIIHDLLGTTNRGARLVFVESPLQMYSIRNALCAAAFENLLIGQIALLPSTICALAPFPAQTALLVNMGHKETFVAPVVEQVTMLHQSVISLRAGCAVEQRAARLIREVATVSGPDRSAEAITDDDWKILGSSNLIEKFVVQYCFVQPKNLQNDMRVPADINMRFGTLMLHIPGFIRGLVYEVLFEDDEAEEDLSLHKAIVQLIKRLPIDLRRTLISSLLVCGGVSNARGLLARLKEELVDLLKQTEDECLWEQQPAFYILHKSPHLMSLEWLGGSLLGNCEDYLRTHSQLNEDWAKRRAAKDWTDFIISPA